MKEKINKTPKTHVRKNINNYPPNDNANKWNGKNNYKHTHLNDDQFFIPG